MMGQMWLSIILRTRGKSSRSVPLCTLVTSIISKAMTQMLLPRAESKIKLWMSQMSWCLKLTRNRQPLSNLAATFAEKKQKTLLRLKRQWWTRWLRTWMTSENPPSRKLGKSRMLPARKSWTSSNNSLSSRKVLLWLPRMRMSLPYLKLKMIRNLKWGWSSKS